MFINGRLALFVHNMQDKKKKKPLLTNRSAPRTLSGLWDLCSSPTCFLSDQPHKKKKEVKAAFSGHYLLLNVRLIAAWPLCLSDDHPLDLTVTGGGWSRGVLLMYQAPT